MACAEVRQAVGIGTWARWSSREHDADEAVAAEFARYLVVPLIRRGPSAADSPLGLEPHRVTASVIDLDGAVDWYQKSLGFTLTDRGVRHGGAFKFAELAIPGFGVVLVRMHGKERAPGQGSGSAGPGAAPAWIHFVFSVPDPDRIFRLPKERV